jgi:hypothetical protein
VIAPSEVFPAWRRAQLAVRRHALEAPPSPHVLRTTGLLWPEVAERVAEWFTAPTTPTVAARRSYRALAHDTARLFEIALRDLGIRVRYVRADGDPYACAADLCADLREHGTMALTTIACEEPHPLLGGEEGGVVDQLRVVHDVFGHAALGLGFDLQSEFATWVQCRTLFSEAARPAAFCELVGAVTAFIVSGAKPGLHAKVPTAELLRVVSAHGPLSDSRPQEPVRPAAVAA